MRWRALRGAAIALALGVVVSVAAGSVVDDRIREDRAEALTDDARDFSWLLESFASSFETTLSSVAAIALVNPEDVDAAESFVRSLDDAGAVTLVDLTLDDPVVVGVFGPEELPVPVDLVRAGAESLLAQPAVQSELRELASADGFGLIRDPSERSLAIAAAASDGTRTYVALTQFPLGTASYLIGDGLNDPDEDPNRYETGITDFVVYATDTPDASQAIMSTASELPLPGTTASAFARIGGQDLLVEVAGNPGGSLGGTTVGGIALGVTAVVAALIAMAGTRREATIEALKSRAAAEGRFRAALQASPDAVLLWRRSSDDCVALNRESLFGHPLGPGGACDSALVDFIDPADLDRFLAACDGADGDVRDGIDVSGVDADGERAHAHVRVSSLDHAPGEFVIVVTDTTSIRRNEAERARLESDLHQAQRMETIGQLAGGIAHDFNNLLAAIAGSAELALLDATVPAVRDSLQDIMSATHRGAMLTKRLLSFSRKGMVTRETVDVCTVIDGIAPLLRRMIDERITLDIHTSSCPLMVRGDLNEIEQVLLNLVVNARDAATGPGHTITVDAGERDGRVLLTVRDNGMGMTPEVREHALEPFFTTKPNGSGTGLGLAIVYGIATGMGGFVDIETSVGSGTTITVELPAVASERTTTRIPDEPVAEATAQSHERILLVEDEPAVLRAAARLLERAGHVVATANDGTEARQILDGGFRPSVLVTDVVLPGTLHGRAVAEHARTVIPDLRVVYASGYPRDVITAEDLIEPDVAFVAKPFTSVALLDAVRGESTVTA